VLLIGLLMASLALTAMSIVGGVAADEPNGTLRGVITIVGQDTLRDGEVVVSFAGTTDAAGTAGFVSDSPEYSLDLAPGDYSVYAWAPVFHESEVVEVTIATNETTWANLTVVRIEEIIGTLVDPKGEPVGGATLQLYIDDAIIDSFVTDDEGRFRPTAAPGNYTLVVNKRGIEALEESITIAPGQVLELDLVVQYVPGENDEEEFPLLAIGVILFIFIAMGGSFGYVNRHARMMRRARMEAEAKRTRDLACPECGGRIPEGEMQCPECRHTLQIRCSECGRSMDAGTPRCPECGTDMD
jgi:hypothetical protein